MSFIIQLRRDTAANWTSRNPVLRAGEVGIETDTAKAKLGDGVTAWNSLPYWQPTGPDTDNYDPAGAAAAAQSAAQAFATSAVGTETARAEAAEALLAPLSGASFTGPVTATSVSSTGLTGATAASRYVGATASGAPASGTFAVGDFVIDQTGNIFICTFAGTPGSWTKAARINTGTAPIQPSPGTVAAGSTGNTADAGHVHGQPPMFAPTGLTGATAPSRYVGATTSGAPASGTFAAGDFIIDQTAKIWICITSGSPGVWRELGFMTSATSDIQPSPGTAATGSVGKGVDAGHVHGQPPMFAPTGLPGATGTARYVGANAGPPSTGTFNAGDWIIDTNLNAIRVCNGAGSPGTWNAILPVSSVNPVALGTASPGSGVLVSRQDHVHPSATWTPADSGLLAFNYDPILAGSTQITTAGTLYLLRLNIYQAVTASNIILVVTTAGVGTPGTGTFVGLYNSSGTLLSGSADVASSLTSGGTKTLALTAPQALTAGTFVWAAVLTNMATTQPTFAKTGAAAGATNAALATASFRAAVNGTVLTALPGSITPASNASSGSQPFWVGLS